MRCVNYELVSFARLLRKLALQEIIRTLRLGIGKLEVVAVVRSDSDARCTGEYEDEDGVTKITDFDQRYLAARAARL